MKDIIASDFILVDSCESILNIVRNKWRGQNQLSFARGTMGFFESEIVQKEAKSLFEDYQSLTQLGGEYGKFDREGKIIFIQKMEDMMERYRVFMKRFELSDDFMAKMTVEQLSTQLGQFGLTPQQMFDQMNQTLEKMKREVEQNS